MLLKNNIIELKLKNTVLFLQLFALTGVKASEPKKIQQHLIMLKRDSTALDQLMRKSKDQKAFYQHPQTRTLLKEIQNSTDQLYKNLSQ